MSIFNRWFKYQTELVDIQQGSILFIKTPVPIHVGEFIEIDDEMYEVIGIIFVQWFDSRDYHPVLQLHHRPGPTA